MRVHWLVCLTLITSFTQAQEMNRVIEDPKLGRDVLIGHCNRDGLNHKIFQRFFETGYYHYEPRLKAIEMLRKLEEPWTATVVMGTWCGDTHREIPRFYRILDEMGVSDQSITLIAVDRAVQADGVDLEAFEIERIPTFIFYKNGKEVGRIVENARETLEDDMLLILSRPLLPAAPDGPNPVSQ